MLGTAGKIALIVLSSTCTTQTIQVIRVVFRWFVCRKLLHKSLARLICHVISDGRSKMVAMIGEPCPIAFASSFQNSFLLITPIKPGTIP